MEGWNKNVKLVRVLNDDHDMKFAAIEGECEDKDGTKQPAVLLFNKTPFQFDDIGKLMQGDNEQFHVDFVNDIYHQYKVDARSSCNDVKLTYICPATPAHIKKYSKKQMGLISETQQCYETIVRPYMEKNQFNAQWVYNIIDGKSERERILFENDDFIILPNIGWDGKGAESMHLLGLIKCRSIHSIRDLKPEHVPMLETVLEKTLKFISEKYGTASNNVRAFFHYPPTFYHLHIHFTTLQNRTCGCEVERAHLVQDVIDHLKLQVDYYQKKTLYYKVPVEDPLFKLIEGDGPTTNGH